MFAAAWSRFVIALRYSNPLKGSDTWKSWKLYVARLLILNFEFCLVHFAITIVIAFHGLLLRSMVRAIACSQSSTPFVCCPVCDTRLTESDARQPLRQTEVELVFVNGEAVHPLAGLAGVGA